MSQLHLLLPRTDHARPDEETGVRIAWAVDAGRPVHIARYSHLRDGGARPELSCLGCSVPVAPVLPRHAKGRAHRQDHFRHKRSSPDCWAQHGIGAQLWNAILHLHRCLDDLPARERGRLRVRAWCDPAQSPWTSTLPLFSVGCDAYRDQELPAWDRVRLSPTRPGQAKVPDIRLFLGDREQLRIRVEPADPGSPPLGAQAIPLVEIQLHDGLYEPLLAWSPTRGPVRIPCTRTSPDLAYRCARHAL